MENRATIEAGVARWQIEPNFEIGFDAEEGESLFREAPGFKVEERIQYGFPSYDRFEKTHWFDTEEQVMHDLVGKIAEQVAHCEHMSAKKDRQERQ